jgi:hypothetical protein
MPLAHYWGTGVTSSSIKMILASSGALTLQGTSLAIGTTFNASVITTAITPIANNSTLTTLSVNGTYNTGTGALTATSTGTTSTADGTVTAQAAVTLTGAGSGSTWTVTTVSNIPTVITQVVGGIGYAVNDTFTIAALPGLTFTVASLGYSGVTQLALTTANGGVRFNLPGTNAQGDTYYRASNGLMTQLAKGAANQIYIMGGSSIPTWSTLLPAVAMPALGGDVTNTAGSITTTIGNNKVTYAKMQLGSSSSRLLGTPSTGTAIQEITLGTGLTMTAGVLSATGGGGSTTTEILEAPSGTKNGTNTTFTITHTPAAIVKVFYNGALQNSIGGADYTISGTTITMVLAPASTDTLLTLYNY